MLTKDAPPTAAVAECLNEIGRHVAGELRTDYLNRLLYSTDASIFQVLPLGVLIPRTIEDVQAAVEIAGRHQVPILPRTSGSSLAGQAVNKALVIDMSRHLDRVLEVNEAERWVRVQPGIVLDELNLHLRPYGLQYGPDPASSNRAAMGGIVSNNSTGSHSILYGMTADHVLEMDVILSDGSTTHFAPLTAEEGTLRRQRSGLEGEIYRRIDALVADQGNQAAIRRRTPRHWRRCGGYNLDRFIPQAGDPPLSFKWPVDERLNLSRLVCGAEGTLAVMTEMKLGLVSLPRHTALALLHFDNLHTALSSVPTILEADPSAVELLDNLGLTMCRDVPEYARLLDTFLAGQPNCILITEFYGESDADLRAKVARLEEQMRRQQTGVTHITSAFDRQRQANVWEVRKVGLGLMMSIKGDHKPIPFIEDAAVPPEHLADYVQQIETFCNDLGTNVAYYAHASAGCIHIRPLINSKDARDVAKMPAIMRFSVELLGRYGGSLSSEHGDGRSRSWINEHFFGPELYRLYQEVKQIFDPRNLLNPNIIVNALPMTENLRYGEEYQTIPLRTHLDFSHEQGYERAIEQCNGAGICRKKISGTMCPSFMVTREEEHSTRGRANLLRAAISGQLPPEALTSRRLFDAMDLCVECKACKAECPSSVDMAKIKFEYLAQYYESNPVPLRSRLFANIGAMNRRFSGRLAPLANWGIGNGGVRWGMEKAAGISRQRELPRFARHSYLDWAANRSNPRRSERRVVLFNDTITTFSEPHIAIAATELLEAAGLEVIPSGHLDEGRPMISKGLVEPARQAAIRTLDKLAPYAAAGIPIVGLEPSSILALRDDYLYLVADDERVRQVAEQALTFEEFLDRLTAQGELPLSFTGESRQVLLHGHCHQKALVGTGPSKRVLSLPPNYTVTEVDSGCCGMAGAFGYEAEHLEISLKMGERRLLPAVREASAETLIVAAGTSCRHQIKHGTGREALHPAELLRQALR